MNKSQRILLALQKIPKGYVTTYGILAKKFKSYPRAVGQIMKNNKHPEKYPCYKVIKSDGSIGGYFGTKEIQKKFKLLKKDGVEIQNNKINKKCFWRFGKKFNSK